MTTKEEAKDIQNKNKENVLKEIWGINEEQEGLTEELKQDLNALIHEQINEKGEISITDSILLLLLEELRQLRKDFNYLTEKEVLK